MEQGKQESIFPQVSTPNRSFHVLKARPHQGSPLPEEVLKAKSEPLNFK